MAVPRINETDKKSTPSTVAKSWQYVRKVVLDLYKLPDAKERAEQPADAKNQVTKGDLHANAINFAHFLHMHRVAEFDEASYAELVKIYNTDVEKLTKKDINNFFILILKALSKSQFAVRTVRLIGDETCDRGNNDLFIFYILLALFIKKTPVEILASNHGMYFLFWYAQFKGVIKGTIPARYPSTINLQRLMDRGIVSANFIKELVEKYYLPYIKAVSYTIDRTSNPPKVSLFTHAPCGLETIRALAVLYKIEYHDKTVDELCNTIDKINTAFTRSIEDGSLFYEYQNEETNTSLFDNGPIPSEFPLIRLIWNRRRIAKTNNFIDPELASENIPRSNNGYQLHFIHGHDGPEQSCNIYSWAKHIFGLDTYLGRQDLAANPSLAMQVTKYNAYYSQEEPSGAQSQRVVAVNKKFETDQKQQDFTTFSTPNYNANLVLSTKACVYQHCKTQVTQEIKLRFEVPLTQKQSSHFVRIVLHILIKHKVQYFEFTTDYVTVYPQAHSKLYNNQESSAAFWQKIQTEIEAATVCLPCNNLAALMLHGFNDADIKKLNNPKANADAKLNVDGKVTHQFVIPSNLISQIAILVNNYESNLLGANEIFNHPAFKNALKKSRKDNLSSKIIEILNDCLKKAAECFAILQKSLGEKVEHPGNITPAVYFYLFQPIIAALQTNPSANIDTCFDKDKLIKNIILCSARGAFTHIANEQIESLIVAVYSKFKNYNTLDIMRLSLATAGTAPVVAESAAANDNSRATAATAANPKSAGPEAKTPPLQPKSGLPPRHP